MSKPKEVKKNIVANLVFLHYLLTEYERPNKLVKMPDESKNIPSQQKNDAQVKKIVTQKKKKVKETMESQTIESDARKQKIEGYIIETTIELINNFSSVTDFLYENSEPNIHKLYIYFLFLISKNFPYLSSIDCQEMENFRTILHKQKNDQENKEDINHLLAFIKNCLPLMFACQEIQQLENNIKDYNYNKDILAQKFDDLKNRVDKKENSELNLPFDFKFHLKKIIMQIESFILTITEKKVSYTQFPKTIYTDPWDSLQNYFLNIFTHNSEQINNSASLSELIENEQTLKDSLKQLSNSFSLEKAENFTKILANLLNKFHKQLTNTNVISNLSIINLETVICELMYYFLDIIETQPATDDKIWHEKSFNVKNAIISLTSEQSVFISLFLKSATQKNLLFLQQIYELQKNLYDLQEFHLLKDLMTTIDKKDQKLIKILLIHEMIQCFEYQIDEMLSSPENELPFRFKIFKKYFYEQSLLLQQISNGKNKLFFIMSSYLKEKMLFFIEMILLYLNLLENNKININASWKSNLQIFEHLFSLQATLINIYHNRSIKNWAEGIALELLNIKNNAEFFFCKQTMLADIEKLLLDNIKKMIIIAKRLFPYAHAHENVKLEAATDFDSSLRHHENLCNLEMKTTKILNSEINNENASSSLNEFFLFLKSLTKTLETINEKENLFVQVTILINLRFLELLQYSISIISNANIFDTKIHEILENISTELKKKYVINESNELSNLWCLNNQETIQVIDAYLEQYSHQNTKETILKF